jgi:cytochrome c oxidase assembly protein subunit 15
MSYSPHEDRLHGVRVWLGLVLGLILLMVAVGGITRLTESGLSMVTWEPILGTLPPMSEEAWQFRFDQYRAFPEYQQLNKGMSLDEFKAIFFWEYLHRLLGRLLGLAYALPLAVFWLRGKIRGALKPQLLVGLILGGGQGVMGWYMVKSGLVDNPFVSHYRLAAHLGLAFVVFAYLLRVLLSIVPFRDREAPASRRARAWAWGLTLLLVVQILWGAFVAGLNAGYLYNTFPTMQGYWVPPEWSHLQPQWINAFDNPVTVQLIHRWLGILLVVVTLAAWWQLRSDPSMEGRKRRALHAMALLMLGQFWLGVFTLVMIVPIALATMHQVMACLLVGALVFLHFTFAGRNGLTDA